MGTFNLRFVSCSAGVPVALAPSKYVVARATIGHIFSHLSTSAASRTLMRSNLQLFRDHLPETEAAAFPDGPDASKMDSLFKLESGDVTVELKQWPEFKWGSVPKGDPAPIRTLRILESLAAAIEDSIAKPSLYNVTSSKLNFLLALTTLHECQHLATATVFGHRIITPPGLGPVMSDGHGESGWAFEETVVGGIVETEWSLGQVGNFEELREVVITMPDGAVYALPEAYMTDFLSQIILNEPSSALPSFTPDPNAKPLSPTMPADSPIERTRTHFLHPDRSPPSSPKSKQDRVKQGLGIQRVGRISDRDITGDYV